MSDAIDFEHLLAIADEEAVDGHLASFATAHASSSTGSADRGDVFLTGLRFVRERTTGAWPGETYRRARWLASLLLTASGLTVGATLAGSLLARRDAEPVNALLFLGCTVGLQVAFLIAVALAAVLRAPLRAARGRLGPARATLLTIVRWLGRAMRLDGARRDRLRAGWATLDLRSERLAPLIACDLLIVTQRFAIAFNGGLLAAMLLVHLPFEELRFGWQSTYSFTNAGVETAVRATAAPWTWLAPTLAPDAADIAATRFARGQRAETLPPDAAHAWWPFLIAAIVVYGLTIRLLLAAAGRLVLRHRLRRLTFTQPSANALWRRLAGPLMQPTGGIGRLAADEARTIAPVAGGVDLLIVDREWDVTVDTLLVRIERLFGGPVARVANATLDDDALPDELAAALRGASTIAVATVASRDPIVAIAGFLRALAARSPAAAITVALIPDAATGGVSDERLGIWRRFVAIQRLRVAVEGTT